MHREIFKKSSPVKRFPTQLEVRFPGGIAVVAPSFTFSRETLKKGLERFSTWNCNTWIDSKIYLKDRYFSGKDQVRAEVFDRAVRNIHVDHIWCARGGYGASRLLPFLQKFGTGKFLQKNPKLLLGYSDVTALHVWWNCYLNVASLHCPMPGNQSFTDLPLPVEKAMLSLLGGTALGGKDSYTSKWKTSFLGKTKKEVMAPIVGGNLSVLCSMVGTKFEPRFDEKILFLEDCAERPYRVDRMLQQMEEAGLFSKLKGVLLGDFEADVEYKEECEKKYWKEIFLERFEAKRIPILQGLPVGHCFPNYPLPFGVPMKITKGGKLELVY